MGKAHYIILKLQFHYDIANQKVFTISATLILYKKTEFNVKEAYLFRTNYLYLHELNKLRLLFNLSMVKETYVLKVSLYPFGASFSIMQIVILLWGKNINSSLGEMIFSAYLSWC